jgi:hypothetical protein
VHRVRFRVNAGISACDLTTAHRLPFFIAPAGAACATKSDKQKQPAPANTIGTRTAAQDAGATRDRAPLEVSGMWRGGTALGEEILETGGGLTRTTEMRASRDAG